MQKPKHLTKILKLITALPRVGLKISCLALTIVGY